MSHAWTHSWCKSPARDEAVRAAEDGRPGPLPTLEEAIAAVTERRPPEPGGGGNVTGGLRTERVTLEITHNCAFPLNEWLLEMVEDVTSDPGESVRVVEEAHFDDLAQVAMERDAAIRERDKLRAERITQALTADRFAAAVQEADSLTARVAELESAAKFAPAANADGGSNHAAPAASGAAGTGWLTAEERAAIQWAISEGFDEEVLRNLLARSTPPEVVLEDFTPDAIRNVDTKYLAGWDTCMALAKRSILVAGVTVKEVGRE